MRTRSSYTAIASLAATLAAGCAAVPRLDGVSVDGVASVSWIARHPPVLFKPPEAGAVEATAAHGCAAAGLGPPDSTRPPVASGFSTKKLLCGPPLEGDGAPESL